MTDDQELAPGALVTPSIRLERLLGRGGMGSVWVAEHLRLRTQVVVKFMAVEYAQNQEAMLRFEREATLAAQAKSPHVVQVFDHGVSQFGLPYIAMELLEGEDLAQRINRTGLIEPASFANWLSQACRGISRAHAKSIVHRDIKPENIFLCDNDGEVLVKVLDFGIAKAHGAATAFSGTQTGAFLGTAYYMSPEQTMGQKDLDHRSDLWALGVVAFYALTGSRPFEADAIGPLVIAITSGVIPTPSSRNPRLGVGVDAWMAKALARPREQRFQSAKEMAEAFVQVVGASSSTLVMERAPASLANSGSGSAPARTGPGGLPATTMSGSVQTDAPRTALRSRSSLVVATLAAIALVPLAGFFVYRATLGAESSLTAAPLSGAAPSPIVVPSVDSLALPPTAPAPALPPVNATPSAPAASAFPVAADSRPLRKSSSTTRPTKATNAPARARVTDQPPTPARVTDQATAPAPAKAAPTNPLNMKME
jgi:eukaryotic-like serine/threonine-protein kinase